VGADARRNPKDARKVIIGEHIGGAEDVRVRAEVPNTI